MFREVWVASSFKGSSGEITTMSYISHHQRNQQTWLEAMHTAKYRHRVNFTGIAVTGWSRYDHMLSLCELLPSSIPSLAYALQTIAHGRIDYDLNMTVSRSFLGCDRMPLWEKSNEMTYISCTFPGHEMYEMMLQYDSILRLYDDTMSFVRLFITDIHLRQNYIHYKRNQECLQRLLYLEDQMIFFIDSFQRTCLNFFTPDIGPEWLQTYFMRKFKEVQHRINFIERTLKTQKSWLKRPLPNNTAPIVIQRRNTTINDLLRAF
jgi:hexosaminidase